MESVFYFTNPTADRHKARKIQLRIEAEVGLHIVSPFYNKEGTPTEEIEMLDSGRKPTVSASEIVATDKKMIRESDGIIALVNEKSSAGSFMEIFYAHEILGKPVFMICADEKLRGHPWLIEYSNKIFGTVDGFIAFAKEKLC